MTNPVRLDAADQWVLDKVIGWRRVRMPWPEIARQLGLPLATVKFRYEAATLPPTAPPPSPAPVKPKPVPKAVVTPAGDERADRKRRGRKPAPPVRMAEDMTDVCLAQACRLMAFPEDALARRARGSGRVRILAAAGFAHWSNQSKNRVATAFGVRGHSLAPSGLAAYQIPPEMIAALAARLWTLGFKP